MSNIDHGHQQGDFADQLRSQFTRLPDECSLQPWVLTGLNKDLNPGSARMFPSLIPHDSFREACKIYGHRPWSRSRKEVGKSRSTGIINSMSDIPSGYTSRPNFQEKMNTTLEGNSKTSSSSKGADDSWAVLVRALENERMLKLKTHFKTGFQNLSLSHPHLDDAQPVLNTKSPGSMTFPQVPLVDNSWAILARTLANERASKFHNDLIMRTFSERPKSMGMINRGLGRRSDDKGLAKSETMRASTANPLGRDATKQLASPSKRRGKGQTSPTAVSCRDPGSNVNSYLVTNRGNDQGPLNKSTMNCDCHRSEAPHGCQDIRDDCLISGVHGGSAHTPCESDHDRRIRKGSSMPDIFAVPPRETLSRVSMRSKCEGPDRGTSRRYQEKSRLEMFLRPTVSSQYKALESLIARTFLEERQAKEKLSGDLKNREEATSQVSRRLTRDSDFYRQEVPRPFPRSRSPKADATRSLINSRTLLGSSISSLRRDQKFPIFRTTMPGTMAATSQANKFETEGPTSALAN